MDAVIKIGGSLQTDFRTLKNICQTLEKVSKRHRLLIVPGGGRYANLVRELQMRYGFSDRTAHLMAIFGMDIYGIELHKLIKGSALTNDLRKVRAKGCSVFLPYKTLERCEELESSWDVTSDSIAAWTSSKIGCERLILVKMVDGIFDRGKIQMSISTQRLKKIDQSVVDKKLTDILESAGVTCCIVNGRHPDRIEKILKAERTICTVISPGAST